MVRVDDCYEAGMSDPLSSHEAGMFYIVIMAIAICYLSGLGTGYLIWT